jgi:alanine racemase
VLRALARIDVGAIARNAARLAEAAAPAALCAVVKADGYGHGAAEAARAAQAGGARWLAVATAEEARALREDGIEPDIVPARAVAEGLVQALAGRPVGRTLIARAQEARDVLPEALRARGADVLEVEVYRWTLPDDLAPIHHLLA